MLREEFAKMLDLLQTACMEVYGTDLVTLAVFGSVARGVPHPGSDIDILLVADNLPDGRIKRVQQFEKVEKRFSPELNIEHFLAPIIKTPGEVNLGSLLFLDMLRDVKILYDKDDYFAQFLTDFATRLKRQGAYLVSNGERWHWVLKPDYRPGEVFEI